MDKKISAPGGAEQEQYPKVHPILYDQEGRRMMNSVDSDDRRRELALKIDGNQKKNNGSDTRDVELGVDLNSSKKSRYNYWEKDEHSKDCCPFGENPNDQHVSQKELKASFRESVHHSREEIADEPIRRQSKESSDEEDDKKGVISRHNSNASSRKNSSFWRTKTIKSRLMDPPQNEEETQLKYGLLATLKEDDEEEPFTEEDLPEEFMKPNFHPLTIFQWVSFTVILAALVCDLLIPSYFKKRTLWDLPLWKWELFILVLICGRLVSGWGIRFVVFFIERNFLFRKRVLYFVYGVRKAVQNCLWLGLVLNAWHFMFDQKLHREVKNKTPPFITKILLCLLVGSILWLVKVVLVKALASSFHVRTYFDRIQESLFHQYVIKTLSAPPKNPQEEENVMAEVKGDTTFHTKKSKGSRKLQRSPPIGKSFRFDLVHKLNQKNISAWNMKKMINIIQDGLLYTLDERVQDSALEDESEVQIKTEFEAKYTAKKIFNNVAENGSKYIFLEDLKRFMREGDALKTMGLFEGAIETKQVSKSALKNWVVSAFKERRALALTLDDTKTAVKQLHHIASVAMCIVIMVIWLLLLGIATTQLLVLISSQLLLVVFTFGNTCKMVFEAIIFLFVMHPFDVGDRCEVDGVQMLVDEMNILTTVFLKFDNQKIIYPNSILATKPISNYYRSPDMGDSIDFCVHISTPGEKIALMKQKITEYIENKKEHWYPSPVIVVKDVEDMNRLKFSVWPKHRMNYQDMLERWARRTLLIEEMIKIFRDLDIEYRLLPHDVNIRNIPVSTPSRLPSNWNACSPIMIK